MQIPILNGIYVKDSDLRTSYPRNLIPVIKKQGISTGYLRPAEGLVASGMGPGAGRGGINWNGICYRVMGTKLISIAKDGTYIVLGDVGAGLNCTLDYSFDRLAISSNGSLYYWTGTSLTKVTDPDLGTVVDFVWVDGYFMTTDGTNLIVTDLNDPTSVNPLKYGSSESDPDPIIGLLKLRNEVHALNRYTIEVFQNVGGSLFPFERIDGAQIMRGVIGTYAAAVFMDTIAFVGSGHNESISVWLGSNGLSTKISTREIDEVLEKYDESVLKYIIVEVRVLRDHQFLYIHLPDQTLVYDGMASQILDEPVWFTLGSSLTGNSTYRARNFVWCYNQWLCEDPLSNQYGYLINNSADHYGNEIGAEFNTTIVYNEDQGAIFHELELVCLTGHVALKADPTIWTSYSIDGETWSQERPRSAGRQGQLSKKIAWLQQGHMIDWRIQKFRWTSKAMLTVIRLEARVEPLNV